MRIRRSLLLALMAVGCNEALGIHAGKPGGKQTGGTSGTAGDGSSNGGSGGSERGGSAVGARASGAGDAGTSGEAGASPSGGTAGVRGGSGGAGGSAGESGAGAGGGGNCDCRAQGFDFCIDGECADITSAECDTILGDEWIADNPAAEPYILGALARFDSTELQTLRFYWNLELAMQEFSAHGHIPIEGEPKRPVLLLCHGPSVGSNLQPLRNSLNHLIQELGVSNVLMILDSRSELKALVEARLTERSEDVFFLDFAGATSPLYTLRDDEAEEGEVGWPGDIYGRLWHMLGDTTLVIQPYVPLVARIEEHVNPGAATGSALRPTRLAFVSDPITEFDYELFSLLSTPSGFPLRINGALVPEQPANVRTVSAYPTETAANELAEFAADIILDFSGNGALEPVVDQAYDARSAPRPFYVIPPERFRWPILLEQIEADISLRTRVLGVNYASAADMTLYDEYIERLLAIGPSTVDLESMENVYDAVYFSIYSAVAGPNGGTDQAKGFVRLLGGPRRDIGPDGIQSVIDRLLSSPSATVSLHGPGGSPDFHRPTGSRLMYANVWCVDENVEYVVDALRYDRASDGFLGTLPCFDF